MAQTFVQPALSPQNGYIGAQAGLSTGLVGSTVAPAVEPLTYDKGYHTSLVEMFEAAEDQSRDNRLKAEEDIDYYDGKQLTAEEVKALKRRGQPPVVKNRVKRKIDFLQGLERAQRTDPRALPRTPQHEQDAHAATDALRAVCEINKYDQLRSRAWADMLKAGWGGIEVAVEDKGGPNPRIVLRRCQWDRMFWDPYSSEEDYSDARYLGLVIWMDKEEAVARYGAGASKVFDETVAISQVGGTFDDRPKTTTWVDRTKRTRVRVRRQSDCSVVRDRSA